MTWWRAVSAIGLVLALLVRPAMVQAASAPVLDLTVTSVGSGTPGTLTFSSATGDTLLWVVAMGDSGGTAGGAVPNFSLSSNCSLTFSQRSHLSVSTSPAVSPQELDTWTAPIGGSISGCVLTLTSPNGAFDDWALLASTISGSTVHFDTNSSLPELVTSTSASNVSGVYSTSESPDLVLGFIYSSNNCSWGNGSPTVGPSGWTVYKQIVNSGGTYYACGSAVTSTQASLVSSQTVTISPSSGTSSLALLTIDALTSSVASAAGKSLFLSIP